jgi:hypothetical protein
MLNSEENIMELFARKSHAKSLVKRLFADYGIGVEKTKRKTNKMKKTKRKTNKMKKTKRKTNKMKKMKKTKKTNKTNKMIN